MRADVDERKYKLQMIITSVSFNDEHLFHNEDNNIINNKSDENDLIH